MQRVIIHLDIDCFYAQVEMVQNPSLRDKPVGKVHTHQITSTQVLDKTKPSALVIILHVNVV
jgi:nucleotidyltransferase/DNA polymerase involved in DNA repair